MNSSPSRISGIPRTLRSLLVRIDCGSKGLTFAVQADGKSIKLGAPDFQEADFTTYTQGSSGQISCTQRNPPDEVVVIYRPTTDGKGNFSGEIVSVEFVPKDVKFGTKTP